LATGFGDLIEIGAQIACSLALWLRALDGDGDAVAQQFE